jgi:hypothetical protein
MPLDRSERLNNRRYILTVILRWRRTNAADLGIGVSHPPRAVDDPRRHRKQSPGFEESGRVAYAEADTGGKRCGADLQLARRHRARDLTDTPTQGGRPPDVLGETWPEPGGVTPDPPHWRTWTSLWVSLALNQFSGERVTLNAGRYFNGGLHGDRFSLKQR